MSSGPQFATIPSILSYFQQKCSTASGSISSQRPAYFYLTLQLRSKDSQGAHQFTFDARDMFLSHQMGLRFVRAAVACAILERTSGLEPSSETTAPRYLKLFAVPNFCSFTFISLWMPLALSVISLVFSALIAILYLMHVKLPKKTKCKRP